MGSVACFVSQKLMNSLLSLSHSITSLSYASISRSRLSRNAAAGLDSERCTATAAGV